MVGFISELFSRICAKFFEIVPKSKKAEEIEQLLEQTDELMKDAASHYMDAIAAKALKHEVREIDRKLRTYRVSKQNPLYERIREHHRALRQINDTIKAINEAYTKRELEKSEQMLSDIDGKSLDQQQREVVVCDNRRCLVLAGAGSGKTLTIAGKVKYLCQEKHIAPEDILLIAFTRKSAEEMTERIAGKMGIPIEASTFHKLGLEIITEASGKRPEVRDSLTEFLEGYFDQTILSSPRAMQDLLEYFTFYLHVPPNLEKFETLGDAYEYEKAADLETLRSKYDRMNYVQNTAEARREVRQTLRREQVKSMEEAQIANFLFLHGVAYEYERLYPIESPDPTKKAYRPDFYLPEYDLYLEHFGVDRNGKLPWLSPIEEKKYQQDMAWKRAFHQENGTTLLETYSWYSSDGILLEKLDEMLQENGVQYRTVNFSDLYHSIYTSAEQKYLSEFMKLCATFVTLFKSNGYEISDLRKLCKQNASQKSKFMRQRIMYFARIMEPILTAYQEDLQKNGAIDFSDMILSAAELVRSGCSIHPYQWVIIDEFQDISFDRYHLVQAILKRTGAKLLCVGDDWQSIYRFAGSDISIITQFERYFGKASIMRLEKTYRNAQQLIDEAGSFVMRNDQQLKKHLQSDKSLDYPITFMGFRENPFYILQWTVNKILNDFGPEASILFLGRTNYDVEILRQSGLFTVDQAGKCIYKASPNTPMQFLSVHKAKGLEADNLILLNFQNSTMGFPSQIADDPVLEMVLSHGEEYPYAEERRLMYVALTRTRNRIFILVDENRPSEFMKEFHSSKSVYICSSGRKKEQEILCPRCRRGHLVAKQTRSNHRTFVGCSNYPRFDYTIWDPSVLTDPRPCPACGGFLVARSGKRGDQFYGCTNYPLCKYTKPIEDTPSETP